jgi:AcrR family transcriptional regulator
MRRNTSFMRVSRRTAKVPPPKDPTLDKLQSAASRVLVRSGLRGATTRRIAAEAGLSEMTLFRRFGTKERLLAAVMDRLLLDERARVVQSPGDDLRAQLLECARAQLAFINRNLPLIRIFVGDPEHFGEEERNVLGQVFAPMRKEMRQILARASLTPAEMDLVVHMLAAIIFVHVLRASRAERSPYSANQYIATAVDMILAFLNQRKAISLRARRGTTARPKNGITHKVRRKPGLRA